MYNPMQASYVRAHNQEQQRIATQALLANGVAPNKNGLVQRVLRFFRMTSQPAQETPKQVDVLSTQEVRKIYES